MAHFIKSSVEYVECNNLKWRNLPVNLDTVFYVDKTVITHEASAIFFEFGNDKRIYWYYDTDEERDKDYERIVNNRI